MTMTLISTTTLGSDAANISVTSIPGTYTDLFIVAALRGTYSGGGAANLYINFNGTSSNHSSRILSGDGSAASSTNNVNAPNAVMLGNIVNDAWTANTFGNTSIYIPNYAGSTNKSLSADNVTENNATASRATIIAGLWSNTAAITSFTLTPELNNFKAGSVVSVYGIQKGSGGASVSP